MAGSVYNRLSRPIAVLGHLTEYQQLCKVAGLDPNNNDVFHLVRSHEDIPEDVEFCRALEVNGAKEIEYYHNVRSAVFDRIRNEARARKTERAQS